MANPAKLIFRCLFGKKLRITESFRTSPVKPTTTGCKPYRINEINKHDIYDNMGKHAGGQF